MLDPKYLTRLILMTYQPISGYGKGVVGTISKKTFNYFLSNNINDDFINGIGDTKKIEPFDNGAWFECDDTSAFA